MIDVTVYTDGSKFPKYKHIGLGAYCKYGEEGFRMSMNIDQDIFKEWSGTEEKVSNPTAELGAAAAVLFEFTACIKPVHIEIVADYEGVKKWSEGDWEAKKPYIRMLLQRIQSSTAIIEECGGKVTYRHIRGHQKGDSPDVLGNNESDKMAKSLSEVNEFKHLIQLINE